MPRRNNIEWYDAILKKRRGALERLVGAARMPLLEPDGVSHVIFGCGTFGCAMPTGEGGVVFKLTNDWSEAAYAAAALAGPAAHPGIVRYHCAVELRDRHNGQPTYALWREEVRGVGSVTLGRVGEKTRTRPPTSAEDASAIGSRIMQSLRAWAYVGKAAAEDVLRSRGSWDELADVLDTALKSQLSANELLDVTDGAVGWFQACEFVLKHMRERGASGSRSLLLGSVSAVRSLAQALRAVRRFELVGAAIEDLLPVGFMLSDVKTDNLGFARRDGRWRIVISDPGFAAFLRAGAFEFRAPPLASAAKSGGHWHP